MAPRADAKGNTDSEGAAQPAGGWGGLSPRATGVALGMLAPLLWSTSGMFIKVLPLPPVPLACMRCVFATLFCWPFFRPREFRITREFFFMLFAYIGVSLTFVTATQWTTATNAIALQATSPAWVFLVACLAAGRILWPYLPPILVILAGLAIIMAEPAEGITLLGNLLGLCSGLGFAAVNIFYSRLRVPAMQVMAPLNLAAAVLLFLAQPGAFQVDEWRLGDWLSLAYLGAFQVGLGHICFILALRRISATQGAVLAVLEPLLNPVWVYLAIGEVPTRHGFAGGALVLCGIALDAWQRRGRPPEPVS